MPAGEVAAPPPPLGGTPVGSGARRARSQVSSGPAAAPFCSQQQQPGDTRAAPRGAGASRALPPLQGCCPSCPLASPGPATPGSSGGSALHGGAGGNLSPAAAVSGAGPGAGVSAAPGAVPEAARACGSVLLRAPGRQPGSLLRSSLPSAPEAAAMTLTKGSFTYSSGEEYRGEWKEGVMGWGGVGWGGTADSRLARPSV